jgi:predicted DNA-binding transcriptional regulator AlpA
MEILTADDVAALLKISKRHGYELTQERTKSGDVRKHPLPALRISKSVRCRRSDVEAWVEQLAAKSNLATDGDI